MKYANLQDNDAINITLPTTSMLIIVNYHDVTNLGLYNKDLHL